MENKTSNIIATIGIISLIPALFLVTSGLLYVGLGIKEVNDALDALSAQSALFRIFIHPAVIIGGILLSLSLNIIPTFRISVHPQDGTLVTTIVTRLRLLNLVTLALGLFLMTAILFYAFAENFKIVVR